jgi:hypothetical protein
MTTKQGCLTCGFADYLKTPTGKLKKDTVVKCGCPAPTPETILKALSPILPASMLHYHEIKMWARGMWPNNGDDGANCSQWKPAEKGSDKC